MGKPSLCVSILFWFLQQDQNDEGLTDAVAHEDMAEAGLDPAAMPSDLVDNDNKVCTPEHSQARLHANSIAVTTRLTTSLLCYLKQNSVRCCSTTTMNVQHGICCSPCYSSTHVLFPSHM